MSDENEMKKEFDEKLQERMATGVQVKTNHFVGLTNYKNPLMVVVDVSGTLGTSTGKRVFLPAVFFEGGAKPFFVQEKRESMVDLQYPYIEQDKLTVILPPNLSLESVPQGVESNIRIQCAIRYEIRSQGRYVFVCPADAARQCLLYRRRVSGLARLLPEGEC